MSVNLIAALGSNGAIGLQGAVPWKDSNDMRWFRKCTLEDKYAVVVIGRKTYESIYVSAHPSRPLPGRNIFVHSRDKSLLISYRGDKTEYPAMTPQEVKDHFTERTLWIAGGAQIYRLWMPHIDRFYISKIDYSGEADEWFPVDEMFSALKKGTEL
jgi:dihydrofolate reductase